MVKRDNNHFDICLKGRSNLSSHNFTQAEADKISAGEKNDKERKGCI
jgi:hypothetical protein